MPGDCHVGQAVSRRIHCAVSSPAFGTAASPQTRRASGGLVGHQACDVGQGMKFGSVQFLGRTALPPHRPASCRQGKAGTQPPFLPLSEAAPAIGCDRKPTRGRVRANVDTTQSDLYP